MAIVKPFKAVRPSRDKVALVSSKSYEAYTPAELGAKLDFNPFTFLHIIHPGYKHPQEISSEQRFQMVHDSYIEFKENGIFIKEDSPSFYVYESSDSLNSFCGIIAATAVDDYTNGHIKKHEGTIKKREQLFETYLKATGFNAEPVLLMYEDDVAFDNLLHTIKRERPEYEFSTTDKRLHRLWLVQDSENIKKITSFFNKKDALYIADGHHRSASSALLKKDLQAESTEHKGTENYNYFMSYLIPESNLKISEFNRFVKDLNGFTNEEFFTLQLKNDVYNYSDALSKLDTEILYRTILQPILGIEDLQNNNRIGYTNNKLDMLSLKSNVDNGTFKVGFGMLPITIEEMKEIADAKLIMPPKTSYIEPKLRSGLTMYEF
jgi:uncharacterized protein (DUF1015 family)